MNAVNSKKKPQKHLGIPGAPGTSNAPGDWAVTDDRWLEEKTHWTDTPGGKAAIEFISRITLGGIFYSLMENSAAMAGMREYEHHSHKDKKNTGTLEKVAFFLDNTVGRAFYKTLDSTVFRGEYAIHKTGPKKGKFMIDGDGNKVTRAREFLRFRENRHRHKGQDIPGRSLGAEMTIVTASFAAMSAGSAIMRNILSGIFNPKERRAWSKDGKFDLEHIARRTAKKIWTIGTYNAGEDMAVALPYVFYMRFQRNVLNKVFHGFKYSSDGVDNGGGLRLDDHGKVKNHMIVAGALDLQGRFTVYNIFTQLYRDLYSTVGGGITEWWNSETKTKAPEWLKQPTTIPSKLLSNSKHLLRYTTISAIRSIIQMTPSVPLFSIFRVPGSKVNGMAVHADHGALHFADKDGNLLAPVRVNLGGYYYKGDFVGHDHRYNYIGKRWEVGGVEPPLLRYADGTWYNNRQLFNNPDISVEKLQELGVTPNDFRDNRSAFFYRYQMEETGQYKGQYKLDDRGMKIPDKERQFDPHGYSSYYYRNDENGNPIRKRRALTESVTMRTTDSIAHGLHSTAEWLGKGIEPVFDFAEKLGYKADKRSREVGEDDKFYRTRLAKDSFMAGIPYASYFAAKVLTRETYVNAQMNMAVERLVDGILSFNKSEVAAGISEISNTVLRQPLEDPERQAELIERRLKDPSDTSPRPIDWSSDLHAKTIKSVTDGKKFDRDAVVERLNTERANHYTKKITLSKPIEYKRKENALKSWTDKQVDAPELENATHLS